MGAMLILHRVTMIDVSQNITLPDNKTEGIAPYEIVTMLKRPKRPKCKCGITLLRFYLGAPKQHNRSSYLKLKSVDIYM